MVCHSTHRSTGIKEKQDVFNLRFGERYKSSPWWPDIIFQPACPYPSVHQEGWTTASALHPVLAAPSGGLNRESPGCSRRKLCWRWSKQMLREEISAGWRGCWVELASDRCRQSAARRRLQAMWSLSPC